MLSYFSRFPRVTIAVLSTVSSAAVLFVAWYATKLLYPRAPPERISMAYFYDQNSAELFEAPANLEGPLTTPTGSYRGMPAGVCAIVFSCGRCGNPSERFIAWLEAPSTAIEAAGASLPPRPPSEVEEEDGVRCSVVVIRTPDDDHWHYVESESANLIMQQAQQRCGADKAPKYCEPPRRLTRDVDPVLLRAARKAFTDDD